MLCHAVVIADDGAGAEIAAGAEPRVADIGKMIDLGAGLDHRLLDLDEIADVYVLAEPRPRPQPPIRSDQGALAHVRAVEVGERADHRVVFDRDARTEHHVGLDRHVAAEFGIDGEKHRLGRHQRHARVQRRLAQPLLERRFRFGELCLGIDAAHVVLLGLDGDRLELHRPGDRHRVGEIEFALAVVAANLRQDRERAIACKCHQSAVAQTDGALGRAGIGFLANGNELAAL